MFHDKKLFYIFVISLAIAVGFPLLSIYVIYPKFSGLLVSYTEQDAIRVASHLAQSTPGILKVVHNENNSIPCELNLEEQGTSAKRDFKLAKFKLFAKSGKIMYSTDSADIGVINTKPYFHDIVAKGRVYTKVIKKDAISLEDQVFATDVVETYVPIMEQGQFIGALEIYYDITSRQASLNSILFNATAVPVCLMIGYIGAMTVALVSASRSQMKKRQSEDILRHSQQRLALHVEQSPLGVIEWDLGFKASNWNMAAE